MSKPLPEHWRPILFPLILSLILFAVNLYICRELFGIEFLNNLSSNDGAFITLARFFQQHGTGNSWFPWFNTGMPIEDAYQPLVPALAALAAKLSGWPIARAFHFVVAAFYCLGPVTLFWFVREWSKSLYTAFIAALAYCLTSPAALLIPILRLHSGALWGGLRLFNLIHYAEDAHNVSQTLLPLALLFLHRAITRRSAPNIVAAIVLCGSGVLANAFGAVDLAIGVLCLVLALNRGLTILVPVGIAAWLWISPMLPPSLISLIREDQWGPHGSYHSGARAWLPTLAVVAVFALLWLGIRSGSARRRLSELERFTILFAYWMCVIPLSYFLFNVTLAPQANRYQVEMEMALCLCFACLCAHIPWRMPLIATLVLLGIWQAGLLRNYARTLIRPVEIATTIEYKVDTWIDRNLPGQRTLVSGDPEYLFNVFSNNPQMSAGHEFSAPNWEQRVAVYTIYSGANAGDRDAEYSLLWLRAFGNQAIYVPGEKSREFYHPIAHPHKFDELLPVLWHDEDDTIFAVPQRSRSLAHVIPKEAVVLREPIHGLDVDPIRPYVAALEDPSLPFAEMHWEGPSRAVIQAPMKPGQLMSVQVTWAPGWRASVDGRKIPLHKDGIGLLVLEPGCDGPCNIRLDYVATPEVWICRILSGMVSLGMVGALLGLLGSKRERAYE